MKKFFLIIVLLAVVGFIALTFLRSPDSFSGELAPNFQAELIDGSKFELSDLRGQYVLLDFWGSWCPPCRRDNPNLVALHKKFNGQTFTDAKGYETVTIALEKNDKSWRKAAEKDGFIWKYQIVRQARLVLTDPLALKFSVSDVPTKLFIGPKGETIGVNMPKSEIEAYLSAKLK